MRVLFLSLLMLGGIVACSQDDANTNGSEAAMEQDEPKQVAYYGKKISEEGAIMSSELRDKMGLASEYKGKVKGEIADVCQAEGCWLNMDIGDGTVMQVKFKDHAFFVPKDISGKVAVVEGRAFMDTTSIEDLKHFAEDAKKSQAEIDAITEPQVELVFEADGVMIR